MLVLSAADHDRLVAVVSHVPHLVAATLMNAAATGAEQDGACSVWPPGASAT